ncbi:MAG: isoprenylcysteine carboxylmethyltransferase family protein [Euryarchaeota archaeon]|nr:isoprenylcysteine carboxylmethyltransferase family protein [Euryarchaeota archaeon]
MPGGLQRLRRLYRIATPVALLSLAASIVATGLHWSAAGLVAPMGTQPVVGASLLAVGLAVRVYARHTLGSLFSYRLRLVADHDLVERGPYKFVRHPMYLGSLLGWPGLPIAFGSLTGLALMAPVFLWLLLRVEVEDAMLRERFGERFDAYCRRTKRLVPYLY